MKSVSQLLPSASLSGFGYCLRQALLGSIILFFVACTNNNPVIKGTLPSDHYHGEWVYWAPLVGATPETVDSARINKDAFNIAISDHNLNKMGRIRVKPVLRQALQDILVFAEAGTIQVKLDSISSASGTPLNEVLQQWKDRKQIFDNEVYALQREYRAAGEDEKTGIQEEFENISVVYHDDIYQIVVENKDNEVGKFIFSLHKSKFTPEQISEIEQ